MSWSASRRSIFPVTWAIRRRQLFLPLGRYAPLRADTKVRFDRGNEWLNIHGRLSPGVGIGQASAAVAAVTARLATDYPATNQLKAGIVVPYDPLGYRNEFRIVETLFFTLTGAVLVVVCLNISGMMLVRSAMRERELSIRHAIGASRGRLARYLLSEAIVLAGLGAVLASVVLFNAPRLWAWLTGRPLPFEVQEALRFDPFIVAICVGLCLATSVVFGFLPATRFSRPVIISSLKDDAGVGGFQAGRVHRFTAALQVAIAVPLIVLSAIALDLVRVTATGNLGFASDVLYAAPLTFDGVADERVALRTRSARDNLTQASGVASATVADGLPLDFGSRSARVSLQVDKNSAPRVVFVHTTRVGDGYLDTMGIPLLVGRGFTHDDSAGAEMVTVISKTLADQLEPDAPAAVIGKRLTVGAEEKTQHTLTIVGVTRDFPTAQMGTARAQLLLPLAQHPSSKVFLIARSEDGEQPMKVTTALENAVRALGPDVDRTLTYGDGAAYSTIVTGVWLRQNSVRDFLLRSAVTGGAGTVILTLAALGIYGVVGLMVATRTREIAVRAALGASRRGVLGMILFDVVKLVMPGVVPRTPHHGRHRSPQRRQPGHPAEQRGAPGLRRRRRDCDTRRSPRQPRPCTPRRVGPADGGHAIDIGFSEGPLSRPGGRYGVFRRSAASQDLLSWLQTRSFDQRLPGSQTHQGNGSRLRHGEGFGLDRQIGFVDGNEFRECANSPVRRPRIDLVAGAESTHARSDPDDDPGNVVAQDDRQAISQNPLELAVSEFGIQSVDTSGVHLDEDVILTHLRVRHCASPDTVGTSVTIEDEGLH